MKNLLSLQRPTETGCRSASYPVVMGHVRLGKPIWSTAAGQAISIFAREILTWLLSLLVKLGGGTLRFCDDLLSGGYLHDRDHTRNCARNVFRPRLEKYIWAILRQEVCRLRLLTTFEATFQHRIPKTLSFFNTEVLPTMMRGVGARTRAASWSGVTYLYQFR